MRSGSRPFPWSLRGVALAATVALTLGAMATPLAVQAQDGDVNVSTATDDLGTYLVGPEGMTLYYFTKDVTPGVSVCGGAAWWPGRRSWSRTGSSPSPPRA
jgi:predicted lipoprotein with Yx(FWY)xxD motif